jgi:phosphoribosyl-ATP pyrophosphohydrolase
MKSFDDLWLQLETAAKDRPVGSRTVELLDAGVHEIGKKVVEEAGEVWLAAEYQGPDDLALEISQLLYHLQVMMLARGVTPTDIYEKL